MSDFITYVGYLLAAIGILLVGSYLIGRAGSIGVYRSKFEYEDRKRKELK